MKSQLSKLTMLEREREGGGKIPRPNKIAACREANRKLGVVCFDLEALSEMDAQTVLTIARETNHIGGGK